MVDKLTPEQFREIKKRSITNSKGRLAIDIDSFNRITDHVDDDIVAGDGKVSKPTKVRQKRDNEVLGNNKMYILNVNPIGKPRMTRSDKWKKRLAVIRYHEFKDEVLSELNRLGLNLDNTNAFNLCFIISMPESWSEKKKAQMNDMPHQVKPDLDNCVKAVFDTVNKADQTIFKLTCEKRWGYKGQIIIM